VQVSDKATIPTLTMQCLIIVKKSLSIFPPLFQCFSVPWDFFFLFTSQTRLRATPYGYVFNLTDIPSCLVVSFKQCADLNG